MKVAWFRADAPQPTRPLDDTAALIAALRSRHDVDVFTAASAHEFVGKDVRAPYDVSVYELDNTSAHGFIWPYLLHGRGILLLRTLSLHESRAEALFREQRTQDYATEFVFNHGPWLGPRPAVPPAWPGTWPMLRVPLLASRLAVVPDTSVADALREQYPDARLRVASTGVAPFEPDLAGGADRRRPEGETPPGEVLAPHESTRFGLMGHGGADIMRRAMARANEAGAAAVLLDDATPDRTLETADVVVFLPWPWNGEPQTPALAAMAAGKPVVVLETAGTANWPALDPQTWRPRGFGADAPIAVSIDPRDEEHSLMLAIRRLASDAALRVQLGAAGRDWWRTHATPSHAAEAWERILAEAAQLDPPARPADWPLHLTADGTGRARGTLDEFGGRVDVLE